MSVRINWVVALLPEAESIIRRFSLKRVNAGPALFPVYESPDRAHGLVISGIGKVNAAAATAFLAGRVGDGDGERIATGWLNFGIAGCSELRYGEIFLASKITDPGSGRSWYPPATWPRKADLPRLPVLTVERPLVDGAYEEGLVEMEAAGFYPTALRVTSAELVQVIKVVSDDPAHGVDEISKETAAALCRAGFEQLTPWLEAFEATVRQESERISDPPLFREWTRLTRFSETQAHQLRRLLQEWFALGGSDLSIVGSPEGRPLSARARLSELREQLKSLRTEGKSR